MKYLFNNKETQKQKTKNFFTKLVFDELFLGAFQSVYLSSSFKNFLVAFRESRPFVFGLSTTKRGRKNKGEKENICNLFYFSCLHCMPDFSRTKKMVIIQILNSILIRFDDSVSFCFFVFFQVFFFLSFVLFYILSFSQVKLLEDRV